MDLLNDMIRAGSHGGCDLAEPMQAASSLLIAHGSVSLAASGSSSRSLCHSSSGALHSRHFGCSRRSALTRLNLLPRCQPAVPPFR